MPMTEDEIRDRHLDRSIRDLNGLNREIEECGRCRRGNAMPILASGHPQADIMLVKYAAAQAEREEGVAFYGRSGSAILRCLERLGIDPLAIYGTLCVKCPVPAPDRPCIEHLLDEMAIVGPRLVVVMGERAVRTVNALQVPLGHEIRPALGEIQELAPSIAAIVVPDLDECLTDDRGKRRFWSAFTRVGDWYADVPPF